MPDERARGRWNALLLSAFGLGTLKPAPGTWASLATAAPMLLVTGRPLAALGLAVALFLYGVWATLACFRSDNGHGDPSWVVSDEVAGQALACLATIPFGSNAPSVLTAFLLFRLFDISKWGPVGVVEKQPGARGVLMDDLVAGGLAAAAVCIAGALGAFSF